jgi:hypothetical protein
MRRLANLLIVAVLCTLSSRAFAAPKEKELPKSGNLSTSVMSGAATTEVPDPFGGIDISDEESAPITGSVSRIDQDTWRMRVYNNSQDVYSVNLGVQQRDDSGRVLKTDNFSYTLKPGTSAEQSIQSASGAYEAGLDLRSYRKLSKPKSKGAPEGESQAPDTTEQ